jgi:hypothetical protein
MSPPKAAELFVGWLHDHKMTELEWPVDDLWYLAEIEFAGFYEITMPHRDAFLFALKALPEVSVQQDKTLKINGKTVFNPNGRRKRTTYYWISAAANVYCRSRAA